jgi:hypothetical protein
MNDHARAQARELLKKLQELILHHDSSGRNMHKAEGERRAALQRGKADQASALHTKTARLNQERAQVETKLALLLPEVRLTVEAIAKERPDANGQELLRLLDRDESALARCEKAMAFIETYLAPRTP